MIAGAGLVPMVVGNLIPLIGVLLFGWDRPSILVMYWIEAGVVGLVNVLKIHKAIAFGQLADPAGAWSERPIARSVATGTWLLPVIWLLAYAVPRDPFARIFVILETIALGGVGIALFGPSVGFLAAMVVAKTAVEIWFARSAR